MLNFGEKLDGVEYIELPGARAIIRNAEGKFAFVDVNGQYFLPGGGLEAGETPEQAVIRECIEEIGARVTVGRKIGTAGDYVFGRKEQKYFHKVADFFEATIEKMEGTGIEADHKLVWRTLEEARTFIKQKAQEWAIQQLLAK